MSMSAQVIGQDWTLTEDEVDKFLRKAKEFDIPVLRVPTRGERPLRATVNIAKVSESLYTEFALSVRPHHQSDS